MKVTSWTNDAKHIDHVFFYEELDRFYSQLRLSDLDTKTRRKVAKKQVIGKDDKPHNVWLEACTNIVCSFDIETSTVYTVNKVTGCLNYWSASYCMQFAINYNVVLFRKWDDVRQFMLKLCRLLHLSPCTILYTWVHNLDFETSYMKHRFNIDSSTYFGKDKQHPIKYLLEEHFYFHDSFSITNSSLAKLAEMYKTKHKKAKGDLDHTQNHTFKYQFTKAELGYVCNDVLVLVDFGFIMFEFLAENNYIPDTATQILNKEIQQNAIKFGRSFIPSRYDKIMNEYADKPDYMKQAILKSIHGKIFGFEYQAGSVRRYIDGIVDHKMFTPYDEDDQQIPIVGKLIHGNYYYDFYEWLFRGGYTKSNGRYTSNDRYNIDGLVEPVQGFDFTSSYPFVQSVCNFPLQKFREIKISLEEACKLHFEYGHKDFEDWRYIFICEFEEIESTDDFALESEHKAAIAGHKCVDNGRIQYADKMQVCLTDCDLALYKLYYKWNSKSRIIKAWKAKAAPLPEYLLLTLWQNGLKKQTLKGLEDMIVEYCLAKAKFNSSYGLCCKQPVYVEYKYGNIVHADGYQTEERVNFNYFEKSDIMYHDYSKTLGEVKTSAEDECKFKGFKEATHSSILSPFWGIWTSAFARYNLLYNVKRISDNSEWITNDTIYCDTDSCYFREPEKHIFIIDEWNTFAEERVKKSIPQEFKQLWKLGQFTNIALEDSNGCVDHFSRFKTLGAKRYLKSYTKKRVSKHGHIKSFFYKNSVTVAGLPKGELENFCYKHHLDIYDEFHDNLDFIIEDEETKVKLGRRYFDEHIKIDIDGVEHEEFSGCTLYPSTFKLTMKDVYKQVITGIIEGSGGKNFAYARKEDNI